MVRRNLEDLPGIGNPPEGVRTAVLELDAGARDQVLHRAGHQNLSRRGQGGDARAEMHSQPGELGPCRLAFPCVDADADLEAELAHGAYDRGRAADRAGGRRESREEAVTGRIYLAPAVARQLTPDHSVLALEQLAPVLVTERVLATVMFTDIAGSTDRAARLGDRRWLRAREELLHLVER